MLSAPPTTLMVCVEDNTTLAFAFKSLAIVMVCVSPGATDTKVTVPKVPLLSKPTFALSKDKLVTDPGILTAILSSVLRVNKNPSLSRPMLSGTVAGVKFQSLTEPGNTALLPSAATAI